MIDFEIPQEHGGMGLKLLAKALVQMELGESNLGALSRNTQGPDGASAKTSLGHMRNTAPRRRLPVAI